MKVLTAIEGKNWPVSGVGCYFDGSSQLTPPQLHNSDNSTKFCFLRGNCGKQLVKFDYHAILLGGMRELAALYSHFTLKLKFICTHTNLSSLESEKNQEQEDNPEYQDHNSFHIELESPLRNLN